MTFGIVFDGNRTQKSLARALQGASMCFNAPTGANLLTLPFSRFQSDVLCTRGQLETIAAYNSNLCSALHRISMGMTVPNLGTVSCTSSKISVVRRYFSLGRSSAAIS